MQFKSNFGVNRNLSNLVHPDFCALDIVGFVLVGWRMKILSQLTVVILMWWGGFRFIGTVRCSIQRYQFRDKMTSRNPCSSPNQPSHSEAAPPNKKGWSTDASGEAPAYTQG